jgi:cytochrome c peroxidase
MGIVQGGASAQTALVALGKALYWDMQVGSDGVQACGSCHFHAGADHRLKDQLNPGHDGVINMIEGEGGANYALAATDFPFHQLAVPDDRNSQLLRDRNDRASSQGVYRLDFVDIVLGKAIDHVSAPVYDYPFSVNDADVRRVEPRNTPTVFNAVFNHRNFWDGRANFFFNGSNPLGVPGQSDPLAKIIKMDSGSPVVQTLSIPLSSLASQAVGPPLSPFEMSAAGRNWKKVGKKMLSLTPLGLQIVDPTDSVLGPYAKTPAGLKISYSTLVRQAFHPAYWDSNIIFDVNGNALGTGVPANTDEFSLIEFNFSMFFGLAVQAYEAILVTDSTPFDLFREGNKNALSKKQQQGLDVFLNKGKCIVCHSGAEFTAAAVSQVFARGLTEAQLLRSGNPKIHDTGFFNTGIRPNEDLGLGDPSFVPGLAFEPPQEGYFKTPGIRNIEFTGPYFHNGGHATLTDIVEFYDRGGDFENSEIDSNITELELTEEEDDALQAFLLALSDDRVKYEKAPFDHPQICVPNGSPGNQHQILQYEENGTGKDVLLEVSAIGAAGNSHPLQTFDEMLRGVTAGREHTMQQACTIKFPKK